MLGITLRGRYKIIKLLGKGGFGETYLAEDRDLPGNPSCVVKRLKPLFPDPFTLQTAMRLFEREAQVLYQLGNHDQIPRLLAHFEENQEFYLVQECIEGEDLSRELMLRANWSEEQAIAFLLEILKILEFVHQQHVIHRDIKPANLMRRASDGKIVLIDFGAVKQISNLTTTHQKTTVAIGTRGYMPAEQQENHPQFNSDIYAVGMTCIHGLTNCSPDELPRDPEIIWNKQTVSPQLAAIIDKMVRYDFRQRYQSVTEVLQALTALGKSQHKGWQNRKQVLAVMLIAVASTVTVLSLPQVQQIVGFSPHSSSSQISFLEYQNSSHGIKLKYPNTWRKEEIISIVTGDIARFYPNLLEKDANEFPLELNVEVQDLKQAISLTEYTNSKVSEITQYLTNARIHESSPTTLANFPAHKVVYSGQEEQAKLKRMAIWLVKNNTAYIFTYTAEESQYNIFLKPAQEMINSLEFI